MNGFRSNQKDIFKRLDALPDVYARRDDMDRTHDRMEATLLRLDGKIDTLLTRTKGA